MNPEERARVLADIYKQLEESAATPPHTSLTYAFISSVLTIPSQTDVNFKNLRFGVSHSSNVTLSNTGQSIIRWKFVPKLKESEICQNWLQVSPKDGMLGPGETAEITFTAFIGRGNNNNNLALGSQFRSSRKLGRRNKPFRFSRTQSNQRNLEWKRLFYLLHRKLSPFVLWIKPQCPRCTTVPRSC